MPGLKIEKAIADSKKQERVRIETNFYSTYANGKLTYYLYGVVRELAQGNTPKDLVDKIVIDKEHSFKISEAQFDLDDENTKVWWSNIEKVLKEKTLIATIDNYEAPREDRKQYIGSDRVAGVFQITHLRCTSI